LTDQTPWSPESEGQSTTQQTICDVPVDSHLSQTCDGDDITIVSTRTHSNESIALRRSQPERRPVDRLIYDKFWMT